MVLTQAASSPFGVCALPNPRPVSGSAQRGHALTSHSLPAQHPSHRAVPEDRDPESTRHPHPVPGGAMGWQGGGPQWEPLLVPLRILREYPSSG